MGSSVDSKNAQRLKGFKYVGTLADGQVWKFDNASGNMIPGSDGNSTNLSEGTSTTTTVNVDSDTGANATLLAASTIRAGVMSKAKFDEVVLNNAKQTNVSTDLSEGTSTNTTVDVNSSDGTNATLAESSTSRAGVMSKAKFDEVVANTLKVTFPEAPNDGTQYARKNLGWEAVGAASGPCAIFDSAGVPTFYATLTLAFAASAVGDTVKMFADITETANITVVIPINRHLDLNGFKYEKTTGSAVAIQVTASTVTTIGAGKIKDSGTGRALRAPSACTVYGWGVEVESVAATSIQGLNGLGCDLYGFTVVTSSNVGAATLYGTHHYLTVVATGTTPGISSAYGMRFCESYALNGDAMEYPNGPAEHCTFKSDGSRGAVGANIVASFCNFISSAGDSIACTASCDLSHCDLSSLASNASFSGTIKIDNCNVDSVSTAAGLRTNYAIGAKVTNTTVDNSAGWGLELGIDSECLNNVIESSFNGGAGYGITIAAGIVAGSEPTITGCTLKIVNTGSYYFISIGGATRANYANNSFFSQNTIVTPINANVTQGIVTISDNQGNIIF